MEEYFELSDDEYEQPIYARLRRVVDEENEDDEVISIHSDDGHDSMDDFIVPDESMMQVDGEECADDHLEEVLSSYRRSATNRAITEMEVTFGCKYSPKPVYSRVPPLPGRNSRQLAQDGRYYYKSYDENKPAWSTMNHDTAVRKMRAMQDYLYAAYCYYHCTARDKRWMVEGVDSKNAGNELLRVYCIIDSNPQLLHFSGLTKTGILRFK